MPLGYMLLSPGRRVRQSFLASVTGFVNDPSGAVAPNLKVPVTDIARGVSFTTTSNRTASSSLTT